MKRLTLLAVALTMVLGMAATSFAAPEVTISGNMLVNAVWRDNWNFTDGMTNAETNEQEFRIQERLDLAFTAVANENLKGVIIFRSNRGTWGQGGMANGAVGGPGTTGAVISVKDAYLDFNWPGTSVNVKAGLMPVALPAAVGGGSIIQDDDATAVLASTAFNDNVSLLAGWIRFGDNGNSTQTAGTADGSDSAIDGWLVALPLNFEGFAMTPFVVMAPLGENSVQSAGVATAGNGGLASAFLAAGDDVEGAWWAGSSFELSMLDPFILKADVNYGSVDGNNDTADREGWLFDIALDYTGFDFMNLELAYAYTSGKDSDNGEDDRLPTMSDSWALGSFFFGAGLLTGDDLGHSDNNLGFHAVALSATGIQSFLEGLTHDAHIVYAWGTNENGGTLANRTAGLTFGQSLMEDDNMLEIDFNSYYKIYDELTLYNGIGYINYDADENDWGVTNYEEDAWKFQVGIKYVF